MDTITYYIGLLFSGDPSNCIVPINVICTSQQPYPMGTLIIFILLRKLINRSQVTCLRSLVIINGTTGILIDCRV